MPLADVEPKRPDGARVDASLLGKHEKIVHDEAYCRQRWNLVKAHVTANPNDLWMCVPLPDAEYKAAKEKNVPT